MYREIKTDISIKYESRRKLSNNLITYRKEHDIARENLALECEIATTHLSKIEHGVTSASVDTLDKLSHGTGISVPKLLSD